MPEAIDIIANRGAHAELGIEVALAVQYLPHERLAARQITIGLNPPAADNLPAAFGHAILDFAKHRRVVKLDPLVARRRAGGKYKIATLAHKIEHGAKCRLDGLKTFLPAPKPDRVKMGIADDMQGDVFHSVVTAFLEGTLEENEPNVLRIEHIPTQYDRHRPSCVSRSPN